MRQKILNNYLYEMPSLHKNNLAQKDYAKLSVNSCTTNALLK